MTDRSREARDLITQADKRKSQSGGLFGFMKDPSEKFEDASDLYRQAANKLKLAKEWQEAGDVYCKSADCQKKIKQDHEACKDMTDAALCFKKINSLRAVDCLEEASEISISMGRHGQAAKHCVAIGEHYEGPGNDLEKALSHYQNAADYFDSEDSSGSAANKARLKIAMIAAQLEQFERAVEIFETVARGMMDNHLLKFSAKEYFLKAGLCRMATGDLVSAERAHETYNSEFPAFNGTREEKLFGQLLHATSEADIDEFTKVVQEYDAISRLDNWMTTILLRIKKQMNAEDLK
jgi:alpha-soluble NSF attachment protein